MSNIPVIVDLIKYLQDNHNTWGDKIDEIETAVDAGDITYEDAFYLIVKLCDINWF